MTITYEQNPRPVGGQIAFSLDGDRLTVTAGRKAGEVRLGAVDHVRISFEPGRFAQRAYRTKVVMKGGKSFMFSSLTWRSIVEAKEQGPQYRAFTRALFDAVAHANPDARFEAGKSWPVWAITSAVGLASLVAMAILIWRALQVGATEVAVLGALIRRRRDLADRTHNSSQQAPAVRPESATAGAVSAGLELCFIAFSSREPVTTSLENAFVIRQLRTTSTEHRACRTIVDVFEPNRKVAMLGRWEPMTTRSAPVFSASSRTSL